ncbi:MAG TPA: glycoside hydrolase family 3 N-terminal domain-containing protein [Terriglobia bacterium]|nr:glycoside hydrolase family 3 N-terminal domain-containing protein [Terriglobia bacterium]
MSARLGQLLLLEVAKAQWSPAFERLLERHAPAGLFFRAFTTIPATCETARKSAQAIGSLPFLAVQEEGAGALCGLLATPLQSERVGGLGEEATEALGDLVGRAMRIIGLNLNLAPTVDLPGNPSASKDTPSVGVQIDVTRRAEAFLRGLSRQGVLPCAGHFPGLSIGATERPQSSPVVARSMATLWREDLVPYRALGSRLPAVQISHAVYKAYDYEFPRPASLSSHVVEGLLRLKLGFGGVALADVSAAARSAGLGLEEAALRALDAGCDLLAVPAEEKSLTAVLGALERASEFGKLARDRVQQALARVQNAKRGLTPPPKEPSERAVSRLTHDFEKFGKQYGHGV